MVAILCSYLLKNGLPPQKKFTIWRHLTEIVMGTLIMYLCYQEQVSF